MANRRFEMYEYRQVLTRMRLGDSDRAIARSGLKGRQKASARLDADTRLRTTRGQAAQEVSTPVLFLTMAPV